MTDAGIMIALEKTRQIEEDIAKINAMTREEMCSLWRYAPVGHRFFQRGTPQTEAFSKRFKELGGFSPQISKDIGWDHE